MTEKIRKFLKKNGHKDTPVVKLVEAFHRFSETAVEIKKEMRIQNEAQERIKKQMKNWEKAREDIDNALLEWMEQKRNV